MAQQGLHHAQVRAAFQQVGGEGVAQHVGADARRVDAGGERRLVEQLAEAARASAGRLRRARGRARGSPCVALGQEAGADSR